MIDPNDFTINIPNVEDLYQFVKHSAANAGDSHPEEIISERIEFLKGIRQEEPGTLSWKTEMDYILFDNFKVELKGAYSPKSGEWADLVSYLETVSVDKGWEVVQKGEDIRDKLRSIGLDAILEMDHMDEYSIIISNPGSRYSINLHLGHKTPKDAQAWHCEEDIEMFGNNPLIMRPSNFSLDADDFRRQVKVFGDLTPYAIAAIYEIFNIPIPKLEFEMSVRG